MQWLGRVPRKHKVLDQPEFDPQRDEPLLGTVVKITLDPTTFALGAGRDASTRFPQRPGGGLRLRGQTLVREDDAGDRGTGLDQLRPGDEALVVDQTCDQQAAVADLAELSSASRLR